jgi:hypothetical protein
MDRFSGLLRIVHGINHVRCGFVFRGGILLLAQGVQVSLWPEHFFSGIPKNSYYAFTIRDILLMSSRGVGLPAFACREQTTVQAVPGATLGGLCPSLVSLRWWVPSRFSA